MRYNTGNPVEPDGSSSPFDLHDNSGNIDLFTNGEAPDFPDRLGRQRKSIAGMESDFSSAQADKEERFQQFLLYSGYQEIGGYSSGITVIARNQVFLKDGEYYRAAGATVLPYTATGDWLLDRSFFVSVGEAVLRQDLSIISVRAFTGAPDGSSSNQSGLEEAVLSAICLLYTSDAADE